MDVSLHKRAHAELSDGALKTLPKRRRDNHVDVNGNDAQTAGLERNTRLVAAAFDAFMRSEPFSDAEAGATRTLAALAHYVTSVAEHLNVAVNTKLINCLGYVGHWPVWKQQCLRTPRLD